MATKKQTSNGKYRSWRMSKQNNFKCQGYESFQRMNYLYQIQEYVVKNTNNLALSSYYGNLFSSIAKKSVLKMEPSIKRRLCKKCKSIHIPDKSCKVKIKKKNKAKNLLWKCSLCNYTKKYPIDKNKTLWLDNPVSVIQTIKYDKK